MHQKLTIMKKQATTTSKKAICFFRVSTQKQDLERQKTDVYRMAHNDGFDDSNIITIEAKESGAKRKSERKGLQELDDAIATNDIVCVYAWELSRLARSLSVLIEYKDIFENKGINFKTHEQSITLFNENGEKNHLASFLFAVLGSFAQMERDMIIERTNSGMQEKQNDGHKFGRFVKYGYYVVNKKLEVNEAEADIVRKIFEMYLSGKYSCDQIAKQLNEMGVTYRNAKNGTFSRKEIYRILTFEGYCGKQVSRSKKGAKGNIYKQIITEEEIKQAKALCEAKKDKTHASTKYNAYCKGLLKDTSDMCQNGEFRTFTTDAVRGRYYNQNNANTVNYHYCDYVAWYIARQWRMTNEVNTEEKARLEEENKVFAQKLIVINADIKDIEDAIKRVNDSYYTPRRGQYRMTDEEFDNKMSELSNEIESAKAKKINLMKEMENQAKLIKQAMKNSYVTAETLDDFDDSKKIELIHQVISQINVSKQSQCDATLHIIMVDGTEHIAQYNSKKKTLFIDDIDMSQNFVKKSI